MLRQSQAVTKLLRSCANSLNCQEINSTSYAIAQQARHIGGDKIPEYWGKPSSYTEGTAFLGTPMNHLDLIKKRPLSPDVIEIDNKSLHYKLPWGAISSITNRATGVALSIGFAGAGYISLTGNLPAFVAGVAATSPILLFPMKLLVAYTLVYHYAGGMRHLVWDMHKIGNQAEKKSLLEVQKVEQSSKLILFGSAALAFIFALL